MLAWQGYVLGKRDPVCDRVAVDGKELLGGLGQLFRARARLFVYPTLNLETGEMTTADAFRTAPKNW
jgi:hypothetical protein